MKEDRNSTTYKNCNDFRLTMISLILKIELHFQLTFI